MATLAAGPPVNGAARPCLTAGAHGYTCPQRQRGARCPIRNGACMIPLIIGIVVIVAIAMAIAGIYNNLVTLRNRVDNAWQNIDTQLQRRNDLIPNVVETVKGYAAHEQETLDAVTAARTAATSAVTPDEKMAADNVLTGALRQLLMVAEAYPDLKANTNFIQLQATLQETEDKISTPAKATTTACSTTTTASRLSPATSSPAYSSSSRAPALRPQRQRARLRRSSSKQPRIPRSLDALQARCLQGVLHTMRRAAARLQERHRMHKRRTRQHATIGLDRKHGKLEKRRTLGHPAHQTTPQPLYPRTRWHPHAGGGGSHFVSSRPLARPRRHAGRHGVLSCCRVFSSRTCCSRSTPAPGASTSRAFGTADSKRSCPPSSPSSWSRRRCARASTTSCSPRCGPISSPRHSL